ncbi:MAG: HAMP domain-containing protein, partial [Trueperaceae bacterium]|nr:HAMP domain-containing protein [Trueperaceae bacterium]
VLAWYGGSEGADAFPPDVLDAALARARGLLDGSAAPERDASTDWLSNLAASGRSLLALVGLDNESDVVAGAQVRRLGAAGGAVVAGARPDSMRLAGAALLTALLVGLVPVLFGVLAALSLTRGLRDSIRYLLVATDRISHGDLEQPVELKRDDELGQIAKAVERMRISLHESLERLRQRR